MNYYRKETFREYLWTLLKSAGEYVFYAWMGLFAPSGAIILAIIAGSKHFNPQITTYLWYGFGFCLLCTIITIFYLLYDGYRKKVERRE